MLDEDVVALSPPGVYRVLRETGVMDRFSGKKSRKGTELGQPSKPHDHWHVDVFCVIIGCVCVGGAFCFMCSVLDGCSRSLVHWDIREEEEVDIEGILGRAREKYPEAKPLFINGNRPQFISLDFKDFTRNAGMKNAKTSPHYPQRNGKVERYHRTIKGDCIRDKQIESLDDSRKNATEYVRHYNELRLHSSIGYMEPLTELAG